VIIGVWRVLQEDDSWKEGKRYVSLQKGGEQRRLLPSSNAELNGEGANHRLTI
jgi:hypothetical protein